MTGHAISRRSLILAVAGAGGALALGVRLPAGPANPARAAEPGDGFTPNAWLTIFPDGAVEIALHKAEMGQGVMTALPMLVAEELDADWRAITVRNAYGDPAYGNFGFQFTFGSMSVASSFLPLRTAGAAARSMLLAAAAAGWGVQPETLSTRDGRVIDAAGGREASYGDLAAAAATLAPPENPPLKSPADFALLGTPVPRLDAEEKSTGAAVYGVDVQTPDMLTAVVLRPPAFAGSIRAFDPAPALAVPGVRHVLEIPSHGPDIAPAIAVVAEGFWPAFKGRQALAPGVQWDPGPNAEQDSASLLADFSARAAQPGPLAFAEGTADKAIARAARQLDVTYVTPFLAHITMEPMSAAAWVRPGAVDVWTGTQGQSFVLMQAAKMGGVDPSQVTLHQQYLGCGLGRRAESDVVGDALAISSQLGAPVKVIWPREEDIAHDFFRPMSVQRVRAGIDSRGAPFAWVHHTVADSAGVTRFPNFLATGPEGEEIDPFQAAGLTDSFMYAVPHHRVESTIARSGVPVGFWRGVGETQNLFVAESVMDALAALAGADPLQYRRDHLSDPVRAGAVLDLLREKSGWDTPADGFARGVAIANYGGTLVAAVVEAVPGENGAPRARRIVLAVDCGFVVNPDIARQQVEGGALFGLSAALRERVAIASGGVAPETGNLDGYRLLRFDEAPPVEVHFVPSDAAPTGLGEPSVVVVPPALANALFALTGERRRELPLG
ncbi:MAG: molybdopterin cofactor-binding domain-containing protein [Chloroflexota bacterium]